MEQPTAHPDEPSGGRIFFSGADRSLVEEDEIRLTSVGIDIGSSTAHLLFSRITLERLDTRYVVAAREVLHASDILLTPYRPDGDIDAQALGEFFDREYTRSGINREDVDSGALILTGVAVRRRNARAIGELFARESGKFVSVSAGDSLEAVMAAHGSGAVAASADGRTILNVDVGGGTTKIAVCRNGRIEAMTAVEAGARLLVTNATDEIVRLEEFGCCNAAMVGDQPRLGDVFDCNRKAEVAGVMAGHIQKAILGEADEKWLRLPSLPKGLEIDGAVFSGGVSEFIYGDDACDFGDLGPAFARALKATVERMGLSILPHADGIRATVVGASQYTVQVSGSTVFIDPLDILPVRNVATIRPALPLGGDGIASDDVARAVRDTLSLYDLDDGERPVAVSLAWEGSATFQRLHDLSRGLTAGLSEVLAAGHPLIIVADGDIGGLLGMHCREMGMTSNPILSIDGVALSDFDFIDIGEVLRATGAVPVVIKSLVFPSEGNATGEEKDG